MNDHLPYDNDGMDSALSFRDEVYRLRLKLAELAEENEKLRREAEQRNKEQM